MLPKVIDSARGLLSLLLYTINTLCCTPILLSVACVKLLLPVRCLQRTYNRVLNGLADTWVGINNLQLRLTKRIHWNVSGLESLSTHGWYLVISNHQSWTDILVLQKVFHKRIPFLKFFLKKELIWVPFLGLAWWALDFPFMKRYSKAFLERHPHLRGKDLETTRKACRKFKTTPISIVNFVEGTRFSREKKERQHSPYAHLLSPKAGGAAYVLSAMGEQIQQILDVTIVYPQGGCSFWKFLCGKVTEIKVRVKTIPVRKDLLDDYFQNAEYREKFQTWLNSLWHEKDLYLQSLLASSQASPEAN